MPRPTLRVATAHLAPHLLDAPATTALIITTIAQAASQHASLITFPESFLPGFPHMTDPKSPLSARPRSSHRISVSLGFSEKARWSEGTLWNSNVMIDEKGEVRVLHRKLVPTFYEKLSWAAGDGEGLRSVDVGVRSLDGEAEHAAQKESTTAEEERVRIGALICGENTNPLARYAMMSQGEDIHISTWPAMWPTRLAATSDEEESQPIQLTEASTATPTTEPTAKPPKPKPYNNILANRLRAGAHCFEAKCFGIMCAAAFSNANLTTLLSILSRSPPSSIPQSTVQSFTDTLLTSSHAVSMFIDPTGTPLANAWTVDVETGERVYREMLGDGGEEGQQGVLYADLDLNEGLEGKQFHDLVGGYQRGDVFELRVNRERRRAVTFNDV